MNLSWVQNPLFTLSGWLIGVAGLIAAFYYGIKGKSKKELSYMIVQSEQLITSGKKRVPKLHLLFENKEIYDITVTTCTIWNTGTQTINRSDIVSGNAFKIYPSDKSRILDIQILATNRETNKFEIERVEDKIAVLNFDYIDPKQGATIQIVHEGSAISFDCEIKGGTFKEKENPNLHKQKSSLYYMTTAKFWRRYVGMMTILLIAIGVMFWIDNLQSKGVFPSSHITTIDPLFFDIVMFFIMAGLYLVVICLAAVTTYAEKLLTLPQGLRQPFLKKEEPVESHSNKNTQKDSSKHFRIKAKH